MLNVLPRQVSSATVLLIALSLSWLSPISADDTNDRSKWLIGYTESRNDLPNGQFENWRTSRACIVKVDGTGKQLVGEELASKGNSWTQFAGWSPDGTDAIILSLWESPENAAWEQEHKTFRMTEGWLVDCCLVDLKSNRVSNLTDIDRVSIYNTGLFFLPDKVDLALRH
ncbi:MAG: hypothetical protein U0930_19380 [Pirellulales bacterium]